MAKPIIKLLQPTNRVLWAVCVDDENKPLGYKGDWPVHGKVYQVEYKPHHLTGAIHVHIVGFVVIAPWGAFAPERFIDVFEYYLN